MFPGRCALCDEVLPVGQKYLCSVCRDKPREIGEHYCLYCGKPVSEEVECCDACKKMKWSFEYGRAAFLYDSVMRQSMKRFKYHGRQEYAAYYGAVLQKKYGDWIREIAPEVMIPVPIHRKRYRKRGYNQAELIARELGKRCGVPVDSGYLLRKKNTLPQKELSFQERRSNLRDAFCISEQGGELSKYGKCVIIIDDIYTTGSTIEACSRVLCNHGTKKIYFLCVCTGNGY